MMKNLKARAKRLHHSTRSLAVACALLLGARSFALGGMVVTYAEDPGAQNTSLQGADVFDFNNLANGVNLNVVWTDVGLFNQLYILNANQYGGAVDITHPNGTKYSVQGAGTAVKSTTLTLSQDSGYFGFWWSAGDAANVLDFFKDGTLVGQFTTANLMAPLGPEYDGNPRNRSLNRSEPYAFINFYGDANTTWDQIVFRNSTNSGFESDNYTSRVSTYDPAIDGPLLPGVVLARIDGTTTTLLSPDAEGAALWGSASAVPGAPLPPLAFVGLFGITLLARARRSSRESSK